MIMQAGDFVAKECIVMKMARKWRRLFAVFVCLAFAVQVAVFYFLNKTFKGDQETENEKFPFSSHEHTIRAFLRASELHSVPIIPMDQSALKMIIHNGSAMDFCSYFCRSDVTTFATFNELFQNKDQFLQYLDNGNFKLKSVSQYDSRREALGTKANLTTHLVLVKDNYIIHLIIFHHHEGNFWWHGSLKFDVTSHFDMRNSGTILNLIINVPERAFEKFRIQELALGSTKLYFPVDLSKFILHMEHSKFISCNYTRARLFHELYGSDESAAALDFKKNARKLLLLTKHALDKAGVPFWLSSGTCLGYFRQCDIFPHGKDVDIGVFIKDYSRLIVKRLTLAGMKLKHHLGKINDSLELSFLFNDIKLDIFFFYEEKNYTWNGGLQTKSGNKYKYVFPKFTLCWTEFLGLKIRIPCETQQYVEANYGHDWFQPVMQWDWKSSPFNVHENGRWPEEEWPHVIQQFNTTIVCGEISSWRCAFPMDSGLASSLS